MPSIDGFCVIGKWFQTLFLLVWINNDTERGMGNNLISIDYIYKVKVGW